MAWPDAVGLTVTYLAQIVAPVHVGSRVPKPRPVQFVQVRRVGGLAQPPVRDRARLDIFCWANTDPAAWALASTVRDAIWALSGTTTLGVVVYDVSEFLGPTQEDDPDTGTKRVWATYELTVRADSAIQPAPTAGS